MAARLKCKAVGDKLFTFTRFPKSQWKSIRTSNAIERLHEEFKRRIKTQTVLPSAESAAMVFWALLQITMRKVDGWQSLAEKPSDQITTPHDTVMKAIVGDNAWPSDVEPFLGLVLCHLRFLAQTFCRP